MKNRIHRSRYFYGNEISQYGIQNGYLDYATLANSFDKVMVNGIDRLFYADINGRIQEPEQIHGFVDNSEEINELFDRVWELENSEDYEDGIPADIAEEIDRLQARLDELHEEQDNPPEIFQYFVVSSAGADIIQEYTNDPLFYLPFVDCYVWGVTHWGTAWDYVLTDVKLEGVQ